MDAAEKETVSATVEAEADKKDPKSDKKSDEPKRKRNLGHLSGSFETNTIYYVEDSKTGAVVPHNSYGSNNFLKLDYQLGRFSAGVQLEYYPHPLVGTPMQGYEYVMEGFSINNLTEKYISWTDRNYSVTVGDFYEQFGSGLILRAWEDRALGFLGIRWAVHGSRSISRTSWKVRCCMPSRVSAWDTCQRPRSPAATFHSRFRMPSACWITGELARGQAPSTGISRTCLRWYTRVSGRL